MKQISKKKTILVITYNITFAIIYYQLLSLYVVTRSGNDNFVDIILRQRWKNTKAKQLGWQFKLTANHPLYYDLTVCYSTYFQREEALLNKKLEFFNYISYIVLDNNKDNTARICLHVGDIVEIEEQEEGIAYAKIKGILRHQANDLQWFVFLIFDWFQKTNKYEPLLGCSYYNLEQSIEKQWQHIFPISLINKTSNVHFIHACTNTCNIEKHNWINALYIKNDFYYKSI
jgi:hypothetical protein